MKKALALALALLMVLGCMSVTVFATETNTWSFNSETMTFTVNSPVPKTATVGGEIPQQVIFEGSFDGIIGFAALWGKTVEQAEGYQYGSKWWNSAASTPKTTRYFEAGNQYGYIIALDYNPQTVQKDLANAKIVWNGKKYSNIGVSVPYDAANELAEIFIVVDFGVLGADGNFTGGDFAETESGNKSGDTDITLTVAKALTYEMVIPEDVTNLNAAGVFAVGQAKVENVKNATDKTVISYTAETTAFKCEGKTDIPASYYTEEAGQNAFPTTAVEVYKNKADAASIPTMYVGISESAWDAAENGTYTATVTFNFSTKEVTPVTAADALVENAYFKLNFTTTQPYNGTFVLSMTYHKTASGFEATELLIGNDDLLEYADGYPANADGSIITVSLNAWEFPLTFTLDTSTNIYSFTGDNNEVTFTSFSVKPAGATEFTEVTLTEATPR